MESPVVEELEQSRQATIGWAALGAILRGHSTPRVHDAYPQSRSGVECELPVDAAAFLHYCVYALDGAVRGLQPSQERHLPVVDVGASGYLVRHLAGNPEPQAVAVGGRVCPRQALGAGVWGPLAARAK